MGSPTASKDDKKSAKRKQHNLSNVSEGNNAKKLRNGKKTNVAGSSVPK